MISLTKDCKVGIRKENWFGYLLRELPGGKKEIAQNCSNMFSGTEGGQRAHRTGNGVTCRSSMLTETPLFPSSSLFSMDIITMISKPLCNCFIKVKFHTMFNMSSGSRTSFEHKFSGARNLL